MRATVTCAAVKQQSDGILDSLNILLMALCAIRGEVCYGEHFACSL